MTKDIEKAVKGTKAPRRKKIASLDRRKARAGWLFVLPFIIGFVIIYLPMIYESLLFSFSKIIPGSGGGGYTRELVGFANYENGESSRVAHCATW